MKNEHKTDAESAIGERRSLLVSVITPCRNEVSFIADFARSVSSQELPPDIELEIVIADGMSDDGTREVLENLRETIPQLRVIDNPEGVTPAALNRAIAASQGQVLVRMDVHTTYAPDYIRQCLRALSETGADNVGGPWRARAASDTLLARTIAAAFQSPIAVGGARSHDLDYEGTVDSVYLGCWPRSTFDRFGLFDETLVRNQDDEHNLRIIRGGGRVWQSPRIRSWYVPRPSLRQLFRQYRQYGYWKTWVIRKHRLPASVRHLVPATFVAAVVLLGCLAPFSSLAAVMLSCILGAYTLVIFLASVQIAKKMGDPRALLVAPIILATFHVAYGTGFLEGLMDLLLGRDPRTSKNTGLTR